MHNFNCLFHITGVCMCSASSRDFFSPHTVHIIALFLFLFVLMQPADGVRWHSPSCSQWCLNNSDCSNSTLQCMKYYILHIYTVHGSNILIYNVRFFFSNLRYVIFDHCKDQNFTVVCSEFLFFCRLILLRYAYCKSIHSIHKGLLYSWQRHGL